MAFWVTSGGMALTAAPDAAGEGAREGDADADGDVEGGMLIVGATEDVPKGEELVVGEEVAVSEEVPMGEEDTLAVGFEVVVWAGVDVQADKITKTSIIAMEKIILLMLYKLNLIVTPLFFAQIG